MNELALDEKTMRFIEQRMTQMKALEAELQGAMNLLLAQNDLTGDWHLDMPGRRLKQGKQNHESHTPNGDQ